MVILLLCLCGLVVLNIVVLSIFIPRMFKSSSPPAATANAQQQAQAATTPTVPATAPQTHSPPPAGAVAQRQEVSPSGKIRIKYVRTKGNPVRQIVLEKVANPSEQTVFFEYKRNAWILISPNDEWIALNNRPEAGQSDLQLYHRTSPDSLNYEIPEDFRGQDQGLDDAAWNAYLEAMELPEGTEREGVTIDATGWNPDSKVLNIAVTVAPASEDDQVPAPWACTFDVTTNEFEESAEQVGNGPDENQATPAASPGQ